MQGHCIQHSSMRHGCFVTCLQEPKQASAPPRALRPAAAPGRGVPSTARPGPHLLLPPCHHCLQVPPPRGCCRPWQPGSLALTPAPAYPPARCCLLQLLASAPAVTQWVHMLQHQPCTLCHTRTIMNTLSLPMKPSKKGYLAALRIHAAMVPAQEVGAPPSCQRQWSRSPCHRP